MFKIYLDLGGEVTSDFRREGLQIRLSEKSQGGEVTSDVKHTWAAHRGTRGNIDMSSS